MTGGFSPSIAAVRTGAVRLARPWRGRSRLDALPRAAVHRVLGILVAPERLAGGPAHIARVSAGIAAGVARMPLQPVAAALGGFADGAGGILVAAGCLVGLVPPVAALCIPAILDGMALADLSVDRPSRIGVLAVLATCVAVWGRGIPAQSAASPATAPAGGVSPAGKRPGLLSSACRPLQEISGSGTEARPLSVAGSRTARPAGARKRHSGAVR